AAAAMLVTGVRVAGPSLVMVAVEMQADWVVRSRRRLSADCWQVGAAALGTRTVMDLLLPNQ
ncbi:hypothetical protein, partial [Deinococcus sp.]|uniref:hypothetical protein n=1 Tax=Deinococcus sp. TaxID=47478 RepID=UPI0025BCD2CE